MLSQAYAQTYYVATSGNNANPGTLAQPWRTFQYACSNAPAGSTVYLRGGTYSETFVTMNVSGTSGNYITFQNYPAETPIIDASYYSNASTILRLTNVSYVKIVGITFANAIGNFSTGVIVEGTSHHVELRNNIVHNIHFSANAGDAVTSSRNVNPLVVIGNNGSTAIQEIILDGNEVRDCRTGYSEGLTINGNVDGFTLTNNLVHEITNIGIVAAGHYGVCPTPANDQARNGTIKGNTTYNCKSAIARAGGIYVDGGKDIVIEQNRCYQGQVGIAVGCENVSKTTSNITVKNNLVYDNDNVGMYIGGYNYPSTGKVTNSVVRNNTFFKNDKTNNSNGELEISFAENCTIQNNIFYTTTQNIPLYVANNATGTTLNYNLYYTPGTIAIDWNGTTYTSFVSFKMATSQETNGLQADPLFLSTSLPTPDLQIQNISPACNAGNPSTSLASGEKDFIGNNRSAGIRIDIGAYENQTNLPVSLREFEALASDKSAVLRWSSVSERDFDFYAVERAYDAVHFETIAQLKGTGSLYQSANYQYEDFSVQKGQTLYYRLKMKDLDGSFRYSRVKAVVMPVAEWKWTISPNPIQGQRATISIQHISNEPPVIRVINALGQVMLQQTIDSTVKEHGILVSNLPSGLYWVILETETGRYAKKVLKTDF